MEWMLEAVSEILKLTNYHVYFCFSFILKQSYENLGGLLSTFCNQNLEKKTYKHVGLTKTIKTNKSNLFEYKAYDRRALVSWNYI